MQAYRDFLDSTPPENFAATAEYALGLLLTPLLRLSGADLSEEGPPRPARPTTLKTREYQLRVAASALILSSLVDPKKEADRIKTDKAENKPVTEGETPVIKPKDKGWFGDLF